MLYSNQLSYAFQDAAAVSFLAGVSSVLETHKLTLSLLPSSPLMARDDSAVREALFDGLIVYSVAEDDLALKAALERYIPLVIVDQPPLPEIPFIGIDNESAACAAAQHLLELGHRAFCIISFSLTRMPRGILSTLGSMASPTFALSRARLDDYRKALLEAGIGANDVPLYEGRDSTTAEGKLGMDLILIQRPLPTALLCLSDALAYGPLTTLREQDLTVPDDLSVLSFDHSEPAHHTLPPLTPSISHMLKRASEQPKRC